MPMTETSIAVSTKVIDRMDRLVPHFEDDNHESGGKRVYRADVHRRALLMGLEALEARYGVLADTDDIYSFDEDEIIPPTLAAGGAR